MSNSTEDYLDSLLRAFTGEPDPEPVSVEENVIEPNSELATEQATIDELATGFDMPIGDMPIGDMPLMDDMPIRDMPLMDDMPIGDMPLMDDMPIGDMPLMDDMPAGDMPIGDMPMADMPAAENLDDLSGVNFDSLLDNLDGITDEPENNDALSQDIVMPDNTSILDDIFADSDISDEGDDSLNLIDDLFEDKTSSDNAEVSDAEMDFSDTPVGDAELPPEGYVDEEISSLLDSIGELDDTFAHLGEEANNSEDSAETSDLDGLNSDFSGIDMAETDMSAMLDVASADTEGNQALSEDLDLGDLLNGLGAEDSELSEIGDLLSKDENSELVDPEAMFNADVEAENYDIDSLLDNDYEDEEEENAGKKKKKKKKKKKSKNVETDGEEPDDGEKKPGLIKRILALFFEEDEDSDSESSPFEQSALDIAAEGAEDNEAILNELEERPSPKEEKKKKEKKKKEKKPKKEKAEKPKKPKKEKAPKAPQPPLKKLPRKKIIVIAIFMITVGIAVIFLGVYYPSISDISNAKKHFETRNYDKAYEYLTGHKLSDEDKQLYDKTVILLKLKRQNDSYINYMKLGMRVEALNALIQGIDTMDRYAEKANELGVLDEYVELSSVIITNLQNTFGVSVETAREWLKDEGTKDYTRNLYEFLGEAPHNPEDGKGDFFSPDISIIVQEERADDSDN